MLFVTQDALADEPAPEAMVTCTGITFGPEVCALANKKKFTDLDTLCIKESRKSFVVSILFSCRFPTIEIFF